MTDFKILTDVEHALKRPGVMIGSITSEEQWAIYGTKWQKKEFVPGLIKIISEIIDNAVDEGIRTKFKHGNKIEISITEAGIDGWEVKVEDNGRGIPSVQHDGIYQAELCWTRAKAGTNFSDDNRITTGMNGVGSFLSAVYSTRFTGITSDGKKTVKVDCNNNLSTVKTTASTRCDRIGTSVVFYPDLARFGLDTISQDHLDVIEDRLVNLTICYPQLQFVFNSKKITCPSRLGLAKMFHEEAISVESGSAVFVVGPSGEDQEFRHVSYVNGLNIKNGGAQVDFIMDQIVSELQPLIKKKWKIDVLPANIKQHLLLGSWIRSFPNPRFDSQTKERLTNSKAEIKAVLDFDSVKVAKEILNRPAIIDPMVQAILYKKELADRLAAARALKSAKKKKIANHIQANHPDPEQRMLLITEGLSASGMIIAVRDPQTIGGYSLKGKILNTRGMKEVDILKNKEISELMAIIGLEFGKPLRDVTELYEVELDGQKYIIGKDDIIVKDGVEYPFSYFTKTD